jgi:hypothetical protein
VANGGEAKKSEYVSDEIFEIFDQPAAVIEPRDGAFDNSTSWWKFKTFGEIRAVDDFGFEVKGRRLVPHRLQGDFGVQRRVDLASRFLRHHPLRLANEAATFLLLPDLPDYDLRTHWRVPI